MSTLLFDAPAPVTLPFAGSALRFPVRRVYCVGRNYAEHIREMGGDERELPFFFQKPADAIVQHGARVPYPSCTRDFQHEVELVLAVGRPGRDIAAADSARHVCGLGVGIDLTRRDVQVEARKKGRPWEIGKSFDHSAPCCELMPFVGGELPTRGHVELAVNGTVRQSADLSQMIWSAAEILSELSRQYRLMPGDLVYTGTPAGVAALQPGDRVCATLESVGRVEIEIVAD